MVERIFVESKAIFMSIMAAWIPTGVLTYISSCINAASVVVLAIVITMILTWMERKALARFQDRYGPNRVGPVGLLQPVADVIKLMLKEDLVPASADRLVHALAPAVVVSAALGLFLMIPFGKDMVAADFNAGLLFFLAFSGLQVPGVIMGGWGSRNKFSVLGGMRTAAQLLSYEVPVMICIVAVVMMAGSLSMTEIVEAQSGLWYAATPWGACGFLIFILGGTAESKRAPFDLPEAESEIVAGYHTEYSGMKFALFFLAEYIGAFAMGALGATLFLGGWKGPAIMPSWIWFLAKSFGVFFVLIWFRATLPRFRVDQLLAFAWVFLFPMSLLVLLCAAVWYYLSLVVSIPLSLAILLTGYWGFSGLLFAEYRRMNRPVEVRGAG